MAKYQSSKHKNRDLLNQIPDQQAKAKKCPDCGNHKMVDSGKRFDVFTGQFKKSLKCTQCRRWIYDE